MDRIIPYLWFDKEAKEAVDFYLSVFDDSEITFEQKSEGSPSSDEAMAYEFKLAGQLFGAINGGSYFDYTFNPSMSLMVLCDTKEEVEELWDKLSAGGKELMPLQAYDFSSYYGWAEDRFGLSWQLILAEEMDYEQKIISHLMFSGSVTGKAKEAMEFYTETFKGGSMQRIYEYEEGEAKHPEANIAYAEFSLLDTQLIAADNGYPVDYDFNETFSLLVMCVTQAEIDYYWEKLSAVPEAEQCGWLKDKYGVTWQIVPADLNDLFSKGTQKQINAVMQAFLQMKKIDMEKLERVWESAAE